MGSLAMSSSQVLSVEVRNDRVSGPMPEDGQHVMIVLPQTVEIERAAGPGVASGIIWWDQNQPVYWKLVNQYRTPARISYGSNVSCMIAEHIQDTERFSQLLNTGSFLPDCSSLLLGRNQPACDVAISGQGRLN